MMILKSLRAKRASKKGFTLMEMLIVIAIIAILIAIAIPVFSAQLDKANEAVLSANKRSAQSIAYAEYLLEDDGTGDATKHIAIDANKNMKVSTQTEAEKDGYTVVFDDGTMTGITPHGKQVGK